MILDIISDINAQWNYVVLGLITLFSIAINNTVTWLKNRKQVSKTMNAIKKIDDNFDEGNSEAIINRIKNIELELQTNGGSSVKDIVNKMHIQVIKCLESVALLESSMKRFEATQDLRLQTLMNQSKELQFILNNEGECSFANKALKKFFGLTDMSGNVWLSVITKQERRQSIKTSLDLAIRDLISFREDNVEIMNALTRDIFIISIVVDPFFDADGHLIQWNGYIKPNIL